jgi:glycosyltransferase involved in cell wall biosynthesis
MKNNMNKTVDILLATYNGEKYIEELLNSITAQTYKNWKLIIHDDGSTDNTVKLIKKHSETYPEKITVIVDGLRFGSSEANFSHLMAYAESDFFCFCDQDDVWYENKLELFVNTIEQFDQSSPLLVYSDLEVVDSKLDLIAASMSASQKLTFKYCDTLQSLRFHNCVTGCAMLANKKAAELYGQPQVSHIRMHDWWLSANVAAYGKVIYLDKATIKYRQHGNNVLGFEKSSFKVFFKKISMDKLITDYHKCKEFNIRLDGYKVNLFNYLFGRLKVVKRKFL